MSQYSFNDDKYSRKNKAFNQLRSQATALVAVKKRQTGLETWCPATRKGTSNYREKATYLGRDVGAVASYFDNKRSAALDLICEDRFTLHYQVYGDLRREAVYGNNTLGVFLDLEWTQCDITISTYPDSLERLLTREKFMSAAREGIPNRDEISKACGWSKLDIQRMRDADMSTLRDLAEQIRVGQSKLTRIVKGFLMLLEVLERGHLVITPDVQNAVVYGPNEVINSFRAAGRGYVWNSRPSSNTHTAVLWRMCGVYPPPELAGSHVHIPADAPNMFMVLQGDLGPQNVPAYLTPGIIYASILTYAMDVSCTGLLQQALIIACSLQENRYFTTAKLPQVVSIGDLMIPAFVTQATRLDKPILNKRMARSIGRVHQMTTFMSIKDVLTSAELSTKPGFDPERSMRSYLSSHATLLRQVSADITPLSLIDATMKLRFHESMTSDDFSDILGISALEGLWLCEDNKMITENGVVKALLDGVHDNSGELNSYDIACREFTVAEIKYKKTDLPQGAFSMGWVSVGRTDDTFVPRQRRMVSKQVSLVKDCEYKPGTHLKTKVRARRFIRPQTDPPTPKYEKPKPESFQNPFERSQSSSAERRRSRSPVYRPASPMIPPPYSPKHSSLRSYSDSTGTRESQPISEKSEENEELTMTQIVRQAALKAGNSLDSSRKRKSPVSILSKVKDTWSQLTEPEHLNKLLADGNMLLTHKEKGSILEVLEAANKRNMVKLFVSIEQLLREAESKQWFLNYVGPRVVGNSKVAKAINELITRGSLEVTPEDVVSVMRHQKSAWSGDVDDAPRLGLKYVPTSAPWRKYVRDKGLDPDDEIHGRNMAMFSADVMSRLTSDVKADKVGYLMDWCKGTTNMLLPVDITDEEIWQLGGPPIRLLDFKNAPTSLGRRSLPEEDSKWLIMAGALNRKAFDRTKILELTKTFIISKELIKHFQIHYDLFNKNSE